MSTDISLEIIKSTQDTLGQFVKKPPLTDKLLKKPPFRFIHDIITAIIKNTGFFDGLFTAEELVSENVKDRDKKIAFLQKIVKVVNIVTDSSLEVRPSKIISGQEPEKTNQLLQKIAEALQNNLSSVQAVEQVVGNKKPSGNNIKEKAQNGLINKKIEKNVPGEKRKDLREKTEDKRIKSRVGLKPDPNAKIKETPKAKRSEPVKKKKPIDIESKESKPKVIQPSNKLLLKKDEVNDKINKPKNDNLIIDPFKDIDDPLSIEAQVDSKSREDAANDSTENNETDISENRSNEKILENTEIVKQNEESESLLFIEQNEKETENSSIFLKESNPRALENDTGKSLEINADKFEIEITKETVQNQIMDVNISQDHKENADEPKSIPRNSIDKDNNDTKTERRSSSRSNRIKSSLNKTKSHSIETENDKNLSNISENPTSKEDNKVIRPRTSLRPPSVRPSSARPGAPRFRESNVETIIMTDTISKGKVNIIVENYDNNAEDDDGSVMVESSILDINSGEAEFPKAQADISGHGHLVQQILETQKELDVDGSKVEIEWEWGARREREASFKEVETIRNGLQALSRAANPLGKLVDYVQEDVEIMRQELLHWRETRKSAATILNHQESITEKSIQPLQMKLNQLEENIAEQLELIHTVKSNISRNEQKIQRLIDGDV